MPAPVYAGLWAMVAASSLLVGAVLALRWRIARPVVGLTMGFGAGALISALAYDLIPDARVADAGVWVAFGTGALLYHGLDRLVERGGSGAGLPIVLGALLDGIPESLVLGFGAALGGGVNAGFLVAVFVSNVPESLAASADLRRTRDSGWIYRLWLAIVAVSGLAGALGTLVAAHLPGADGRYAQGFAAGAVLTMVAGSMTPEAYARAGRPAALVTALGFAIAAVLTLLD